MLRLQGDALEGLGEERAAHAQVEFIRLDLSSLQSVMEFVEEFKRKGYQLQFLICNGGVVATQKGMPTKSYGVLIDFFDSFSFSTVIKLSHRGEGANKLCHSTFVTVPHTYRDDVSDGSSSWDEIPTTCFQLCELV